MQEIARRQSGKEAGGVRSSQHIGFRDRFNAASHQELEAHDHYCSGVWPEPQAQVTVQELLQDLSVRDKIPWMLGDEFQYLRTRELERMGPTCRVDRNIGVNE
jgi:hypothetical protein